LPFVFPLVVGLGYDPIWWGVINVMVIEIGMITPPIGLNVFVVKSVAGDVPLSDVFRGIAPFVAADAVKLVLLVLFPALVLFLPRTMG
jgi:TRAP-type C4-dicarboxylate transport system permease large subunit